MIGVCITTLNEADSIGNLVRYFKDREDRFRVYVIDDVSTDGTPREAVRAGVHYIQTNHRRIGIGPSLMEAWRVALEDGCSHILQIDAGGSHDPIDAEYMTLASEIPVHYKNRYQEPDLIIGSRFIDGARYFHFGHRMRPFLSKVAAFMCNWAHGSGFSDWTSGYRMFSRACAEKLLTYTYLSTMHGWQMETLARASAAGFVIVEEPIVYVAGRSSFNLRVAWEAFQVWVDIANHIGWSNSRLEE